VNPEGINTHRVNDRTFPSSSLRLLSFLSENTAGGLLNNIMVLPTLYAHIISDYDVLILPRGERWKKIITFNIRFYNHAQYISTFLKAHKSFNK
jgi:hypothetical protein